jgi:hypothetical protein
MWASGRRTCVTGRAPTNKRAAISMTGTGTRGSVMGGAPGHGGMEASIWAYGRQVSVTVRLPAYMPVGTSLGSGARGSIMAGAHLHVPITWREVRGRVGGRPASRPGYPPICEWGQVCGGLAQGAASWAGHLHIGRGRYVHGRVGGRPAAWARYPPLPERVTGMRGPSARGNVTGRPLRDARMEPRMWTRGRRTMVMAEVPTNLQAVVSMRGPGAGSCLLVAAHGHGQMGVPMWASGKQISHMGRAHGHGQVEPPLWASGRQPASRARRPHFCERQQV